MARKLCFVVAVLALIVVMQQTAPAQDAREVLQAAVKAMGAANVKTIQYSGTGWNAAVGQSFSPQDDWPHFEVTRYTRTIDYDAKFSREELTRRQGDNPPRGGGGTPLQGEQQQVAVVKGNYAWNMDGQNPVPQPGQYLAGIPVAEFRLLDIHQGDPRLSAAHNSMEITLTNVQPNVAVPAITVPDAIQKATAPPVRAESQKLADGVWLIAGGTHNSLAVDFRDFVTVIEAP